MPFGGFTNERLIIKKLPEDGMNSKYSEYFVDVMMSAVTTDLLYLRHGVQRKSRLFCRSQVNGLDVDRLRHVICSLKC